MNKIRILLLISLFLLTTNIATIISGLKYSSVAKKAEEGKTEIPLSRRIGFFEEQLGLTQEQRNQFMKYNQAFNQEARRTTTKIEDLRYQMIDELARKNPDQAKLINICSQIGDLHSQLKQTTISYYLDMKNICNGEQQNQLHELFKVMADPQGDINSFGRGQGMHRGMNGRRGPWWLNEKQK
jgi:Spy/CpxP family protein refolding chaperone